MVEEMKLEDGREVVPVNEFKFQDYDGSYKEGDEKRPESVYLTCKNHSTALYSSKNPYQRGLHFLQMATGFPYGQECPCSFSELVVVLGTEEW